MKIAFIGCGIMGTSILKGILKEKIAEPKDITAIITSDKKINDLKSKYRINACIYGDKAIAGADVIILAVLPDQVFKVSAKIKQYMRDDAILISIVAGLTIESMEDMFGKNKKIVRTMPNTLVEVKEGYSAICVNSNIKNDECKIAEKILEGIGRYIYIDEKKFSEFTAFSCSGPMWIYNTIEFLIDAGIYLGFSREMAQSMVSDNMIGAAKIIEKTGAFPFSKVLEMCSPGGITIEGLKVLQEEGVSSGYMKSIIAAFNKAKSLESDGRRCN